MKIKYFFILFFLNIPLQILPMSSRSHKLIPYSLYASRLTLAGFTIFRDHYLLPCVYEPCEWHNDTLDSLVNKEIKKTGLNPNNIKTIFTTHCLWFVDCDKYLNCDIRDIRKLESLESTEPKEYKKFKHELGHIKNKDCTKRTFIDIIQSTPLLVLGKVCTALPSKKAQFAVAISAGLPLYAFTRIFDNAHQRHKESLADENIPNEKKYLKAAIRYFKTIEKEENEIIQKANLPHINPRSWRYYWYMGHPATSLRINRCNERLTLLESNKKIKV